MARPKVALWFRYGPAVHTALCHAVPGIVAGLAEQAEVHYFSFATDLSPPEPISSHATLHTMPFRIRRTNQRDKLYKTLLWIALLPWLGWRCRRLNIQLVYMDETLPLAVILARVLYRGKLVITVADCFADIYLNHNTFTRWIAAAIKRADARSWRQLPLIFTRARNTCDFLAGQGVNTARIVPIYNPCDFGIFHPRDKTACRAKYGFSPEEVLLVHHGVLHPNKGNDRILRALAKILPKQPQLRFLLIGDGPEMPSLRALIKELGIAAQVTLTGWLPQESDVSDALNASDIGLVMRIGHASDDFHVTDTLVHCMACGLPVLAARLGGVAEIVQEGRNGLLFAPDDMTEFTSKLERFISSATLRATYGRMAQEDAQRYFSLEENVRQTVAALGHCLSNSHTAVKERAP